MHHPLAEEITIIPVTLRNMATWLLTSCARFTSLCFWTYSLTFPLSIHSDTIANASVPKFTPRNGRTFGCRRCFQATVPRQNLYERSDQERFPLHDWGGLTLGRILRSLVGCDRTILMEIGRPRSSSLNAFARPRSNSSIVCSLYRRATRIDLGTLCWEPHISHNTLRNAVRS